MFKGVDGTWVLSIVIREIYVFGQRRRVVGGGN